MIKLHPIVFTLGLVLSKLALFMWLPTLLALLTGMNGQQALAFTALNLPFGLALLLGMALLAPLPVHWRLPGIVLLLVSAALATLQMGGNWLNPLAIWSLYALLGLEILWQSRARVPLATGPRSRVSRPRG